MREPAADAVGAFDPRRRTRASSRRRSSIGPLLRDEHVERSRLLDAIAASGARIVIVTAPPGFGKSTLLAQWAARCAEPERVAWVPLDADDRGAAAVGGGADRAARAARPGPRPGAGRRRGARRRPAQRRADRAARRARGDARAAHAGARRPAPRARRAATRDSLDWVLARLPARTASCSRAAATSALPSLGRLRVRGEVLDLRTDDLRFADDEAQRFLGDRLGLRSTPADVAALEQRTEGWPAALYLAALRLRLGDEVGDGHGAARGERRGPLRRADRRAPALLARARAALHPRDRGARPLQRRPLRAGARRRRDDRGAFRTLTRTSLLLSPLDRGAHVVSLPPPLRDALRSRLLEDDPARARELHGRAGAWFETEGGESELHEAMHHYLAAREWDLAAELLARHALRFVQSGALGGRARDWLARFPAAVVREDAAAVLRQRAAGRAGRRPRAPRRLAGGRRARGLGGPDARRHRVAGARRLCLTALLCFDDLGGALAAAARGARRAAGGLAGALGDPGADRWHAHLLGEADEAQLSRATRSPARCTCRRPGCRSSRTCRSRCSRWRRASAATSTRRRASPRRRSPRATAGPLRGAPHTLPVTCAARGC